MPIQHINLPSVKTTEQLKEAVQHQVNLVISQINAQKNRWNNPVDAQGFTVTNLPWPVQGGDAVPLKYLQQATNTTTITNANSIRQSEPVVFNVIFKAAIQQDGNVLLGMSWGTAAPLSGYIVNDGVIVTAGMDFTNGLQVQDHFPLPPDWVAPVDLTIYWLTSSGTANPTWSIQFQSIGSGTTLGHSFNTASTVIGTATTSLTLIKNFIPSINVVGCNPGDLMFFNFGRSDLLTDHAELLELRFDIRRNIPR